MVSATAKSRCSHSFPLKPGLLYINVGDNYKSAKLNDDHTRIYILRKGIATTS